MQPSLPDPEQSHTAPRRIQLRRTKGWRKPEGAVVVSRPSKWGNPFVRVEGATSAECAKAFAGFIADRTPYADQRWISGYPSDPEIRAALAGRELACWCPLDQPCHADVLLRIANEA